MVMPARSSPYYTVEDVHAFPDDGNRYELVYGELLVSPPPRLRHERVVRRLGRLILDYCERERVGEVFCTRSDLTWGRSDTRVEPDVFVAGPEDSGAQEWVEIRHVRLVVEVLSPSTRAFDRFRKRVLYADRNVPVYWIIDADEDFVEVWRPGDEFPHLERERLTWHPDGATVPLVVELRDLFAR
jgi:Uma2 family endonuclease